MKRNDNRIREVVDTLLVEGDCYEIILENDDGYISEGSRSNLFFIRENTLFTSPVEDVLPGITRKKVIEIAESLGIELHERGVRRDELYHFEAMFLTGTSIKILPVLSVEKYRFDTNHPILRSLMESYDRCIESYIETESKRRS
jgi:branched-chain amino acid aminotransferase